VTLFTVFLYIQYNINHVSKSYWHVKNHLRFPQQFLTSLNASRAKE